MTRTIHVPIESAAEPPLETTTTFQRSDQTMNPLKADFTELFRRHLCRHSQFGINVIHLLAVLVTYWALLELVELIAPSPWISLAILIAYLAVLAANTPLRVTVAVGGATLVLQMASSFTPAAPWWLYVIIIVVCHRIQVWSHRFYNLHFDMTAFAAKYQKGAALFFLLALYEMPLLLNYLLFNSDID